MKEDFREELAKNIESAPKEERRGILAKAQETSDYWQARQEKITPTQEEEIINNGLGVLLKKKILYHGSATNDIDVFKGAEETTVGEGVYFTSTAKEAIGYAKGRSQQRKGEPILYEASVENLKLVDLRNNENVKRIFEGFLPTVVERLEKANADEKAPWYATQGLEEEIKTIQSGKLHRGNIREVVFHDGAEFTKYLQSLGYDGLITLEGGEGDYVGHHDTYLIFNPEKAKISRSNKITKLE